MALVLKQAWYPSQDLSFIAVDENSLDYSQDGDGGWGVDTNPDRADRCLVFFAEHVNPDTGTASFVTQTTTTNDTDAVVGIGDGLGLTNTDTTRFKIEYSEDGWFIFYMLPIERDTTRVAAGTLGDLYFNTDNSKVYYYDGSSWVLLESDNLDAIKTTSGIKICNAVIDGYYRKCMNTKVRTLKPLEYEKDNQLRIDIRELKIKQLAFRAAALEGNYLTAGKLIKSAQDVCNRL